MINKKMMNEKSEEKHMKTNSIVMFKALVMSLILSLILVIVYALLLSFTAMSDGTMSAVTQAIIIISIAFSSIYAGKRIGVKGWLYGLILGIAFIIILAPINMFFGQTLSFDKFFAAKMLMGSTVGLIGGIIGVNIK